MEKTVLHHMIPLSLLGTDWEENKITLTSKQHTELHQILDLNYKIIRRFRKKINQFVWKPQQILIDETISLHKKFFSNFSQLPLDLQKKHAIKIQLLALRAEKEYSIKLQRPRPRGNYETVFFTWLKYYHNILRSLCI